MASKKFKDLIEPRFNKLGLTEIGTRASFLEISYEYVRQICNGAKVPTEDRLEMIMNKLGIVEDQERIKLHLAAQVERTRGQASELWTNISDTTLAALDRMASNHEKFTDDGRRQHGEAEVNAVSVGLPHDTSEVPVYSAIRAGSGNTGSLDGEVVDHVLICEEYRQMRVFCLKVVGDSMVPELFPGEYALFRPINGAAPREKDICAVEVEGWDEWVVKFVVRDPSGLIQLISANPAQPTRELRAELITIKGVLVESRRIRRKPYTIEAPYSARKK